MHIHDQETEVRGEYQKKIARMQKGKRLTKLLKSYYWMLLQQQQKTLRYSSSLNFSLQITKPGLSNKNKKWIVNWGLK